MKRGTYTWLFFGAVLVLFVVWFGTRPIRDTSLPVAATDVAFSELAKGDQSQVTTRENYLIRDAGQLKKLWSLLNTSVPMPTVDFSKNDVIAVFSGQEPSAGYVIAVAKVADAAERMVTVEIAAPGPSCSAAQVVTTPYQVLILPKTDLALSHEDIATTTSCWQ